jgi:hypothetical protein
MSFLPEVGHRGEDTASDDVALDLPQPELDLIQPEGEMPVLLLDLSSGSIVI